MKKYFLASAFCIISTYAFNQQKPLEDKNIKPFEFRKVENKSFTYGEKLEYRLHYGPINAGYATLEIGKNAVIIDGRRTMNIKVSARSSRMIDVLVNKIRDDYETYLDEESMSPLKFTKTVEEGKYKDSDFALFKPENGKVSAKKGSVDGDPYLQDLVSVYYWTRLWDVTNAKIGDVYPTVFYLDGKIYNYHLNFLGRDIIDTDLGKFRCLKVRPLVKKGSLFKSEDALTIWVSDDDNHVVLKVESEIMVGAVAMTLTGFENLKNPVSSKISD
ncbi:MAG: DUF3108 domain-containing protein [Bacteroidota bacterium]|jgi:Protein of unknown function (DUF3108)